MITKIICYGVLVACILYMGDFHITFKPFSISLKDWRIIATILCIALGLYFYGKQSYHEGVDDVFEYLEKELEKNNTR